MQLNLVALAVAALASSASAAVAVVPSNTTSSANKTTTPATTSSANKTTTPATTSKPPKSTTVTFCPFAANGTCPGVPVATGSIKGANITIVPVGPNGVPIITLSPAPPFPTVVTLAGSNQPVTILPGQVVPGQVVPGQVVPGQVIPGQATPGQVSVPGQVAPVATSVAGNAPISPTAAPASFQGAASTNTASGALALVLMGFALVL